MAHKEDCRQIILSSLHNKAATGTKESCRGFVVATSSHNFLMEEEDFPKSLQNAKEFLIGVLENKNVLFILHKA